MTDLIDPPTKQWVYICYKKMKKKCEYIKWDPT